MALIVGPLPERGVAAMNLAMREGKEAGIHGNEPFDSQDSW